ncbi:MAG: PepSY-like domain-containing protein [Saprospiraceae bacterium]
MQKMMLFLVLCLAAGFRVSAQKMPPGAVLAAFSEQFRNIKDLDWKLEKSGDWEADFEQEEVDMSASFSADGKWLETETEMKVTELPAPVQAALKGKKVKEAAKILRADGSTVYEAEVRRKDWIFDANGKLLSEGRKD